ncbi:hypothetical protein ACT691_16960 [Vibrio metschnikovii]
MITAGRDKKWTQGSVNPPVQRASTIVFDTVADKHHATVNRANKTLFMVAEEPPLISPFKKR